MSVATIISPPREVRAWAAAMQYRPRLPPRSMEPLARAHAPSAAGLLLTLARCALDDVVDAQDHLGRL